MNKINPPMPLSATENYKVWWDEENNVVKFIFGVVGKLDKMNFFATVEEALKWLKE